MNISSILDFFRSYFEQEKTEAGESTTTSTTLETTIPPMPPEPTTPQELENLLEVCTFNIKKFNTLPRSAAFYKAAMDIEFTEKEHEMLGTPGWRRPRKRTTTTTTTLYQETTTTSSTLPPETTTSTTLPPEETTTTSSTTLDPNEPTTTTTTIFEETTTTSSTTQPPTTTSTTTISSGQIYPAVILLDFDGHTVPAGGYWSSGTIAATNSGLLPSEQLIILNNCISDYSPYKVTVTTDEGIFLAAPTNRRMRCIITQYNEWYGSSAGGVAYIGSFTWGNDTPCWVFSKMLNYNTKYIQEAVSHEVGHTFNLRHQAQWDANCVKQSDYYYGANGEAPIMGVGYYQPNVHWWIGPTPLACNDIQNDDQIIANLVGRK